MADWRTELSGIINGKGSATRAELENAQFEAFLNHTAKPALQQLAEELTGYGRDVAIREAPASIVLTVRRDGLEEITFRVMKRYVSSGIVPYAEVRLAKGTHYAKYEASFKEPQVTDLDAIAVRDIITSFLKHYRMIHGSEAS